MSVRFSLLAKMFLAVIFGILTLVALYASVFYVPLAFYAALPGAGSEVPKEILSTAEIRQTRFIMIATGIVSLGLAVLFGWLTLRFAKKWRQF